MPIRRFLTITKAWLKSLKYGRLLFVVLAFALMVFISYRFVSDIVRKNLQRNIRDAISSTEAAIKADMLEPESLLAGISQTIRNMILIGIDADTVNQYIQNINAYMQTNEEKRLLGVHGFYGVFDVYGELFLSGDVNWQPPEDFDMQNRPFYIAAVDADGDIGITQPYFNIATDAEMITFARRIFDDAGQPLGIVCLNIFIDRVKQHAINTQFAENGYGFLLNQDMELIAHPDPSLLGMRLRNVRSYIARYEDELKEKGYVNEITTTDYRNIKSIVFLQRLQNGWYMGVVTPRDKYYQSTRNMAWFLSALGAALALILIIILARISTEKDKADERMRIMFDAMPLGANIHDKDFRFFDCNDGAVKMFGLSSKQEYREKFKQLSLEYQPDGELSSEKMTQYIDTAFADGFCHFEWMHRSLKSEPIPCEVTLVRVEYNNEYVIAAYMRDLREIKAATAKMREADERMRIMFDAAPMGASFWNKDGRAVECNQEMVRMFDLPNKQEYLDRFFELSPEYQPDGSKSREKITTKFIRLFEEGYSRFEWMHQKLNGEQIPSEITLIRITYDDDYIVVGYVRDLRELNAMLDEIQRESEKSREMAHWYNSILNAIPLPISVTDANMRWTFINAAVEKILGITLEDAIGKPCSNWGSVFCNTPDCGIACIKKGITRTYFSDGELSLQVDTSILKDLNSNTIGYIEVAQDITNLKVMAKKQAEAEAANIAKTAFLAKVSHEIRTPMNAIIGITEIQLQNESLEPYMQEALEKIYNSGYLLLGIINDILDLSKIEAGKLELAPVNYDVPSLINDTVHLNVMRFDNKPIVFDLQVNENIPLTLFGDELRIKQILNNLLSNAFKYTDSGVVSLSISVEAAPKEGWVTLVFRVSDTGQGMTAEQVNKLFDEYTRFNTEANRTLEGTGLGMSITKNLVNMMNGGISVESKPGKGSVFTVRLPQGTVDSGVLGSVMVENLKQFRLGRMAQMKKVPQIIREYMPYGKVLIVDDVETNLYVGKGLMAPYGLSIDTAISGDEAIEKIKSGAIYDIVFMDHFMPKMDGIEATKIIRDFGYTRPIIALTANALLGQAEMFLTRGFDGFISKPIDVRQLNETLNKMVRDVYPAEIVEAARRQKINLKKNPDAASFVNPELVKVFIRDAEKAATVMEVIHANNYRRIDDVQVYVINAHAMKSALANIGETELSGLARKLEEAGREQNIAVLSEKTPVFMAALRKMIEKIKPKETYEAPDDIRDDDHAYLLEKLAVIQKTCAEYDKKNAKNALEQLQQKKWPRMVEELLDTIAGHLLHGEFTEAAKLAENYKTQER